jgi:hypothetical protein
MFERGERNSLKNDEEERSLLVGHISKHEKEHF